MTHPLAGSPAPRETLIDPKKLERQYFDEVPDARVEAERVAFGTSGHRGSAARRTFNEAHIAAITQAICEVRAAQGVSGPLYLGIDTHALSAPAQRTALEVLAANGVRVRVAAEGVYTPTPAVSHAILRARGAGGGGAGGGADGVVITPSHNPPDDGGFKYNPPTGGPADAALTKQIEQRANELLLSGNTGVKRVPYERAARASTTEIFDFVTPYVEDLGNVVDLRAIAGAKLALGADPMGGASVGYWGPIAQRYGVSIEVVNASVDPTFAFMPLDHDGKIRMDCSSPHAMAGLIGLKDRFRLAFGNDADSDRHGIVTPGAGLMNPNHYLAAAIAYLFTHRPGWREGAGIGKTLVSSSLIDRVARDLGRRLVEVPVGFKWFVDGLLDGSLGFGGEESAGASFVRFDGTPWSTDKDGILLDLLAAEMLACTGKDPGELYEELAGRLGRPIYTRIDAPASPAQKDALKRLTPAAVKAETLAGQAIRARLTEAPGNGASIGGLKVVTDDGWFAARPSGTEDVYKIYAESFVDEAHLARVVDEARAIVSAAFEAG